MSYLLKRLFAASAALLLTLAFQFAMPAAPALADNELPFKDILGRWTGEGRLGSRSGTNEVVKCRVTYVLGDRADRLQQAIRCASASGSIEVKSAILHENGTLKGTWSELLHNMNGEVTGAVTQHGFRVNVRGPDLSANMDIIVKGTRQIIEIQFQNSSLIGLTLVLAKG